MNKARFGRDLTEGSIPRHLLAVALPMLLGNLINSSYSIVDAIWIGQIAGKQAMGAIAVSFPIIFIFVAVAGGATMATTILVSQFYGARNTQQVEKTVSTSFLLSAILGIALSAAGIVASDSVLRLMGTPESILPLASPYLKITFLGFPIIYFSFLITSILRGIGDTKTPLVFMSCGVAINALLDPLLIAGYGPFPRLGLNGAAIASVLSSMVALAIAYVYLNKKGSFLALRVRDLRFDKHISWLIIKIGFPSMLQQSAVSLGMAAVVSFVNKFGDAATAAFGAAGRIDSMAFIPAMSIGMAVSAIAGQNLGARKIERVKQTFRWGILMTVCISAFFSIFFIAIPELLLSGFISDPEVISIGKTYLRIVGPTSVMFAIMFVSNGIINGAGHTFTTLIFTLVSLWGIRVPLAALLSRTSLGITGIWISFAISFAIIMSISLLWYRSGRWQKEVIRKNPVAVEESDGSFNQKSEVRIQESEEGDKT